MNDAFNAIELRIKELEKKLAASPNYRELVILCKTRDDLVKLHGGSTSSSLSAAIPQNIPPVRVTILEGARLALVDKGHPMTVRALVDALPQYGARVGGEKPTVNLSSILSARGEEFVSIMWNDQRAWWLKNRPIPKASQSFEEAESPLLQEELSASIQN